MKKYLKDNIKSLPFIIITFVMLYSITTFASEYLFNSNEVQYDNSTSGIRSSNVQDAIDELYGHATDYSEIKSIIGNDSLTTNSQTLTGAINEIRNITPREFTTNQLSISNSTQTYINLTPSLPNECTKVLYCYEEVISGTVGGHIMSIPQFEEGYWQSRVLPVSNNNNGYYRSIIHCFCI